MAVSMSCQNLRSGGASPLAAEVFNVQVTWTVKHRVKVYVSVPAFTAALPLLEDDPAQTGIFLSHPVQLPLEHPPSGPRRAGEIPECIGHRDGARGGFNFRQNPRGPEPGFVGYTALALATAHRWEPGGRGDRFAALGAPNFPTCALSIKAGPRGVRRGARGTVWRHNSHAGLPSYELYGADAPVWRRSRHGRRAPARCVSPKNCSPG